MILHVFGLQVVGICCFYTLGVLLFWMSLKDGPCRAPDFWKLSYSPSIFLSVQYPHLRLSPYMYILINK